MSHADPPAPAPGAPQPDDDWLLAFAAALADLGGTPAPLTRAQTGTILRLARDVAHGVERRFAPLAAYLAGRFVAERVRAGATAEQALAEASAAAERLLRHDTR